MDHGSMEGSMDHGSMEGSMEAWIMEAWKEAWKHGSAAGGQRGRSLPGFSYMVEI